MSNIYILKLSETTGATTHTAYRVANIDSFNWNVRTPVSPMPLPEEGHDENVLVKMEGNSADGTIAWRINEEDHFGTYNTANNTFTATNAIGATAANQIKQWRDEFIPKSVKDRYRILIQTGTTIEMSDDGTLGGISFRISGDSPVVWSANLNFMVGTVYTIFEADVPERPSKVSITGGSGQIVVNWTVSTSYASDSDAPAITGTSVKYKRDGDIWIEAGLAASGQTYTLGHGGEANAPSASTATTFTVNTSSEGGALTAGTYRVKVANLSGDSHEGFVKHYRNAEDSTGDFFVTVT